MIFQQILDSRNLTGPIFPLWKLKVTEIEYQALKNELIREFQNHHTFTNCKPEALLYYAEWWRREYVAQNGHKYINLFRSLGVNTDNEEENAQLLKETAWVQFKNFHLEPTIVNKQTWRVYSMLYQGGLPLGVIVPNERRVNEQNNWSRLLRDMICDNADFVDANEDVLIVAHANQSIREFCETLVSACNLNNREAMPFVCQEDGPIYQFLTNEVNRIERNHRSSHPISIKWEFRIDDIDQKIFVTAIVNGRQSFSPAFLESIDESSASSFTLRLCKTDLDNYHSETLGAWDYFNGHCPSKLKKRINCLGNSILTITKDGGQEPVIKKELDLDAPMILYKDEETDSYFSCERLKNRESLVLLPSGWSVNNEMVIGNGQAISSCGEYSLGRRQLNILRVTPDETVNLILQNEKGDRFPISLTVFNTTTGLRVNNIYDDNFIAEPIYEMNQLSFYEEYNDVKRTKTLQHVKFRLHGNRGWMEPGQIPIGNIDACVQAAEDRYVKPLNFIFIGTPFRYIIRNQTPDACDLEMNWDSGSITIRNATQNNDGSWRINRASCPYTVECIANDQIGSTFELTLNSPFKEVRIYKDGANTDLIQDSYIPLSAVHSYYYHIDDDVLIRIDGKRMFNINVDNRFLNWQDLETGQTFQLNKYGPITNLLGRIGKIRELLDFQFESLVDASITVQLESQNNILTSFIIKDYPFRICINDRIVRINDENGHPVNITPKLRLCSLTNPDSDEIDLIFNDNEGTYHIPEIADDYGISLIYGSRMVLPKAFHPVNDTTTIEQNIATELQKSQLYSDVLNRCQIWFSRCGDSIPFSSILDLRKISDNPEALLKFALQCFLNVYDNNDDLLELKNELLLMQNDLVFYWWWLCSYDFQGQARTLLAECEDPSRYRTLIEKYAFAARDIQALNPDNEDVELSLRIINYYSERFDQFMRELITDSIVKDLRHDDQGFLEEGKEHLAAMLFDQEAVPEIVCKGNKLNDFLDPVSQFPLALDYSQYLTDTGDYNAILQEYSGRPENEYRFLISARLMYEHFQNTINIFNLNCDSPIAIRRSIMYCFQHMPGQFFYFMKHPHINYE